MTVIFTSVTRSLPRTDSQARKQVQPRAVSCKRFRKSEKASSRTSDWLHRGILAARAATVLGLSAEPNCRAEDRDEREDEPDVNFDRVIALGTLR